MGNDFTYPGTANTLWVADTVNTLWVADTANTLWVADRRNFVMESYIWLLSSWLSELLPVAMFS